MRLALSVLACFSLAAVACSGGDDGSGGSLQIDPVNAPQRGTPGSGEGTSSGDPTSDATPAPTSSSDPTTSPPPAATDTTPTENTCETATDLGSIPGEDIYESQVGNPKTITGTCSQWVKIRVQETSSLPSGTLGVDAKLTSPSNQKFNLTGYVDKAADDLACTVASGSSSTTLGNVDDVPISWSDSYFSDDSRTVTFEIKSANGKCPAGAQWSLTVNEIAEPDPTPTPYGARAEQNQ